jgi:hypothetical protein
VVADREKLKSKKFRIDSAMDTINTLAPDIIAVSKRATRKDNAVSFRKGASQPQNKGGGSGGGGNSTEQFLNSRDAGENGGRGGGGGGNNMAANTNRSGGGGGPAAPSSPMNVAPAEDAIMSFEFSGKNGDNNGYVYWLGTEGKTKKFENPHANQRLRITSSGMSKGDESAVVSRKRGEVSIAPGQDVFLCMDLGRSRTMVPTHYTLCHGSASAGNDLLAFTLEGYSKAAGT